jgi:DNA polymerase-1
MIGRTWLIFDADYVAHRAFFSMGHLRFNDAAVGTIYGFIREVIDRMDHFDTSDVVFAFDSSGSLRRKVLPCYKSKREEREALLPTAEQQAKAEMRKQIHALRDGLLHRMGFANVFSERGYEADDIIASIVKNSLEPDDEAVIVSSDQDLYQLLSWQVRIWQPSQKDWKRRMVTAQSFFAEWKLRPEEWPFVKAYAGCDTDDVPGVPGVKEVTAAKYLRGELRKGTKTRAKLDDASALLKRNLPLVELPYAGTPTYRLRPSNVTPEKWGDVCDELGFQSISDMVP